MERADESEIIDLVERRGPATHRELMEEIHCYSSDAVARCLEILQEKGAVERDGRAWQLTTTDYEIDEFGQVICDAE
jgi:DNA-binding HxlR family transcriptional regulator